MVQPLSCNSSGISPKTMEDSKNSETVNEGLVFFGEGRKEYSLEKLLESQAEYLGEGTFGFTYRVFLECGETVAVKRLKICHGFEIDRKKIEALAGIVHENLLPLRAYNCGKYATRLVSDFMPMGSLESLLHGVDKVILTWEIRRNIVHGVARGVARLHSQGPNLCHGNIRSSNVFLTDTLDPRLAESGIAHLVSPSFCPELVAGYRAPELTTSREVSHKTDVYSFGVLLLEMLTGISPKDVRSVEETDDLPKKVRRMLQESTAEEVFDRELLECQSFNEEQIVQTLRLAISCTFQYPNNRPSMVVVTRRLQEIFCGFRNLLS